MTDWSDVVQRHGPAVWATAWRLLGDHADASDCFQETFVAAVKLSRRQQVKNWPALLKRIATARALDRLRQRTSAAARHDPSFDPVTLPVVADPTQNIEATELAERLKEALTDLPAHQAEAFCLHVLEDLSYDAIAEQMNVKVNHVGVLIHRARAKLRELLDPNGVTSKSPGRSPG